MDGRTQGVVMRLTVLVLLVGCAVEPPTDYPLTPHPEYRVWWKQMEACSGRRGNYDAIRRYEMESKTKRGHYEDRNIWIHYWHVDDRETVAHEELHALGVRGHSGPEWGWCRITKGR
jgi:hypothetical protein